MLQGSEAQEADAPRLAAINLRPSIVVTAPAAWVKPAAYGLLNITAATCIVFANKAVLSVYGFEFTTALTLLHTLTTVIGMTIFSQLGIFSPKSVPTVQVRELAARTFCSSQPRVQWQTLFAGATPGSCLCGLCGLEQSQLEAEHCGFLPNIQNLHHANPYCD